MKEIITIKNVTKKYKNITAVDNISLSINDGELFSLLGVNGAGKTTTIKMLSSLTKPTSGEILINGKDITRNAEEIKKIIALSPQETAVAANLTVKENLLFMAEVHKFTKQEAQNKTNELIKMFSLEKVTNMKALKLSGGYKRRLSIAMALISGPKILFLDEPTLGLDVISRSELWQIIKSLKGGVTIILTTHYMEEAENLSDKVAIMKDGKILITGSVNEIKEKTGEQRLEDAFIKTVKEEVK